MTLVGTLLVSYLALMLTPEGDGGLSGYVKLAAALCVLCVAISPVSSFFSAVLDFKFAEGDIFMGNESHYDYAEIHRENLKSASAASIAEGLSDMLCRDLLIKKEQIEVSVSLCKSGEDYAVESVTVVLVGVNSLFVDPHEIISYVSSLLDCRCQIVYA